MSRYDSRHFVMSYIIRALEHNSVYEVMVQAKNRYGWNEVSERARERQLGFRLCYVGRDL
jgi:UDP-N-acetylglucosamine 2-epimerase